LQKSLVQVADVVLRKDEMAAGQTYKYARLMKDHIDLDGKVMSAGTEYKLLWESKFRTTTRQTHKLVLIVLWKNKACRNQEG
jgi:hypothetical protein